jgi:hypothetical protein
MMKNGVMVMKKIRKEKPGVTSPKRHQLPASRAAKIACNPKAQEIDIAALAEYYCGQPESLIAKEELLEHARRALAKYELDENDLEIATPVLARTLHMLVEQNGGKSLSPERMMQIERHILDWCVCPTPPS